VLLVEVNDQCQAYVPIKLFCDYLGLDSSAQHQRIRRHEILSQHLTGVALFQSRQYYKMSCLELEYLPGWLFGVVSSRVKPALAPKLRLYREECFGVLWRVFQRDLLHLNAHLQDPCEEEGYSWLIRVRESVRRACKRASQAGLPATLTIEQWLKTLEHFGGKCAYCQGRSGIIIEHFIPLPLASSGTTRENCVPSCYACNSKKGNSHPDEVTAISREALDRVRSQLCLLSKQTVIVGAI